VFSNEPVELRMRSLCAQLIGDAILIDHAAVAQYKSAAILRRKAKYYKQNLELSFTD
jgi:hypothetical protein